MYFFDDRRHHAPHVHAEYAEFRAAFGIPAGNVVSGSMPPRQSRLFEKWIRLRADELLTNWHLAVAGQPLQSVPPLEP